MTLEQHLFLLYDIAREPEVYTTDEVSSSELMQAGIAVLRERIYEEKYRFATKICLN